MKKLLKTLVAMAFMAVPLTTAAQAAPEVGVLAPNFTTVDIAGNDFNLADHKGDIVVLEWTNHQCPFVVKHYDTKNMQNTQKSLTDKGVKWVSIVSSAEGKQGYTTAEEAAQVVAEQGAYPTVKILDPSGEIGKMYDAKTTPHMFVIDAEGKIAYMGAIDDNSSPRLSAVEGAKNYVTAAVDDLMAGNAVEVASTQPYGCGVKY